MPKSSPLYLSAEVEAEAVGAAGAEGAQEGALAEGPSQEEGLAEAGVVVAAVEEAEGEAEAETPAGGADRIASSAQKL